MSDRPTREMVLAEPSGPRMDAWVAEHWMRWKLPDDPALPVAWMRQETPQRWVWAGWWAREPRSDENLHTWEVTGCRVWEPSTDFGIVAPLLEEWPRNWTVEKENGEHVAALWGGGPSKGIAAFGDKPAHAICRVLLLVAIAGRGKGDAPEH